MASQKTISASPFRRSGALNSARSGPVCRGFVFLELLLALIIIAILAGGYFSRDGGPQGSQSTYQRTMTRTDDAVCKANRSTLMTQVHMFKMNNPNQQVTTVNMRNSGYNPPTCPKGGVYSYQPDGRLTCSKHPDTHLPPELVEHQSEEEVLKRMKDEAAAAAAAQGYPTAAPAAVPAP